MIIRRKGIEIRKEIIIETNGGIYPNGLTFKDKKNFIKTKFSMKNNKFLGYERFDYLYLEDTLPKNEWILMTHKKIKEFF